jgi:hypothetical protein
MTFEALIALGGVALVVIFIFSKCYTFFIGPDDEKKENN